MNKLISENLGLVSVDSLKIRIEYDLIKKIDSNFEKNLALIDIDSGEYIREFQEKSLRISRDGITFRFAKEYLRIGKKQVLFLTIQLNAKLLETNYFQGIDVYNFPSLYGKIRKIKVFDIPLRAFREAYYSDLDLKIDILYYDINEQYEFFKNLSTQVNYSNNLNEGVKLFPKNWTGKNVKECGITFNSRNSNKTFHKFYIKEIELKNKSNLFYEKYFKGIKIPRILRQEVNFKNSAALEKYNFPKKFLEMLFFVKENQDYLKKVFATILNNELIVNKKEIKRTERKKEKMNINDKLIFELIKFLIKGQYNINQVIKIIYLNESDRKERYKVKKKLLSIYEEIKLLDEKSKKNIIYGFNGVQKMLLADTLTEEEIKNKKSFAINTIDFNKYPTKVIQFYKSINLI